MRDPLIHHHDLGKLSPLTLAECQGYNAILVIVDWFTKANKYEAAHMELNSEGFAKII
jgi:hypothetical protein